MLDSDCEAERGVYIMQERSWVRRQGARANYKYRTVVSRVGCASQRRAATTMPPPNRQKELEAQVEELKGQVEALAKRNAADKAQMQTAIEMEKRLRTQHMTEAAEARAKADELRQVTTTLQQDKDELEIAISAARANEQQILEAYNALDAQLRETYAMYQHLEAHSHTQAATIQKLQDQVDRAAIAETTYQNELATAVTRANELEAQWLQNQSAVDDSCANLRAELADRDERMKAHKLEHQSQLLELEATLERVQAELTASKTLAGNLEKELSAVHHTSDRDAASAAIKELQEEVFKTSTALVAQGETLLTLTEAHKKVKLALQVAKKDVSDARALLLRGISGPDVDVSLYQHVRLEELVRLRLKAEIDMEAVLEGDCGGSDGTEAEIQSDLGLGMGSLGKLEREMRLLRSRNKRLSDRAVDLEKELSTAVAAMDDVKALKEKTAELAGRQRTEKELRTRTDAALVEANEKIVALSEHIEKLMVHLKHEAAAKAKAQDALKAVEAERRELIDASTSLTKKTNAKDRVISELQQGSKILEDQLRLMDEKYIELRNKLDWSRTTSQKESRRLQHELNTLRCKWQLAMDTGQLPTEQVAKKMATLSSSASESKVSNNRESSPPSNTASSRDGARSPPPPKRATFDIPKLPQPASEDGTPWSDAKLGMLQKQLDHTHHHTRT
ncbi:hypothetical protein, variant 2 [Aphanomyces invadans]|uniref:Uncharacterized protein n=1 Tax=Aphanomyces invadans TaxID=157072 RepID=A0A024U9B7_9STRA|nr:hypothetical protein, variant 2 [Aphanomyces invadans]ETW02218.1 hypothetical protein, variant 2 [Aphanomyces invadans]|eukprot:XP_008868823.1 hypothetical protein, variant 2 [Aphanomyces invadans]